jgi:hypothetical protein
MKASHMHLELSGLEFFGSSFNGLRTTCFEKITFNSFLWPRAPEHKTRGNFGQQVRDRSWSGGLVVRDVCSSPPPQHLSYAFAASLFDAVVSTHLSSYLEENNGGTMQKLVVTIITATFLALVFAPSASIAASAQAGDQEMKRGCCSAHGGVCGCSANHAQCCDGQQSPTCACRAGGF